VDALRETDRPATGLGRKETSSSKGRKEVKQQEEMAPLKLYGMPLSPNVVRVATVLNEKGLDFEIIPVDLTTGAHKQPDFLALNVRLSPTSGFHSATSFACCACLSLIILLVPYSPSARSRLSSTETKSSTVNSPFTPLFLLT